MKTPQQKWLVVLWVFVFGGFLFSAVSTYDFVAHLDRQVHAITCSFIPGLGAADTTGATGCYAALMSPYSSMFRTSTWGGVPIALLSLSVFMYLLFLGVDLRLRNLEQDRRQSLYLIAACALPVLASVIYFFISVSTLGTVCKLCVGIYLASIGAFVCAVGLHLRNRRSPAMTAGTDPDAPVVSASLPYGEPQGQRSLPWGRYGLQFFEGVLFVVVPLLLYLGLKPEVPESAARCGALLHPEDKYGVRVKLHAAAGGIPAIELVDPLCPSCTSFSRRLEASGLSENLDLEGVLFPLDRECNWMVSQSLHPGACAVSEAVLCAGSKLPEVLAWAAENSEDLRRVGATDSAAVYARIKERFPALASCIGKPEVRAKLNKSLRWIVSNSLSVVTPQLFVRGQKLCDEDTDLGLEYSLSRLLLAQQSAGAQRKEKP